MVLVTGQGARARIVRRRLHDQQSLGVTAGTHQLFEVGPVVQRETDPAVLIGHGNRRHHDPRLQVLNQKSVMAKERWYVRHVRALGRELAFNATVEAHAVMNVGPQKDIWWCEGEAAAKGEVLPVRALAERSQHRNRRPADNAEARRVTGLKQCGGFVGTHLTGGHRNILPDATLCGNI